MRKKQTRGNNKREKVRENLSVCERKKEGEIYMQRKRVMVKENERWGNKR